MLILTNIVKYVLFSRNFGVVLKKGMQQHIAPYVIKDLQGLIEDYDEPCERVFDIKEQCRQGRYRHKNPLDSTIKLNCREYCTRTRRARANDNKIPTNIKLSRDVIIRDMKLIDNDGFNTFVYDISNAKGDIDDVIAPYGKLRINNDSFFQNAEVSRPESDILVIRTLYEEEQERQRLKQYDMRKHGWVFGVIDP